MITADDITSDDVAVRTHANGIAKAMAVDSTTIGWIAMKVCTKHPQRMNPDSSGKRRLTFVSFCFFVEQLLNGFPWNLVQLSVVNPKVIPWLFSLAPPIGQPLLDRLTQNLVQIYMVASWGATVHKIPSLLLIRFRNNRDNKMQKTINNQLLCKWFLMTKKVKGGEQQAWVSWHWS